MKTHLWLVALFLAATLHAADEPLLPTALNNVLAQPQPDNFAAGHDPKAKPVRVFPQTASIALADTNEIRVVKRTDAKVSPGYLTLYEEVIRGSQTNLLRITTLKDGVTNSIAHNFYHEGAYLGRYTQGWGHTFVNSATGAPYVLSFVWDSSNQIKSASVMTTNYVMLDLFTYTNGIFHPAAGSVIEESNRATKGFLHRYYGK